MNGKIASLKESQPELPNLPSEILEKLPEELNARLREYHCASCGRFLAFQAIVDGTIIIKCRRCKEYNVLDVHSQYET